TDRPDQVHPAAQANGVAGRFIRTLKENLLWVRHFATVAELVEDLREFKRRYNEQWLIERPGFRTPHQARTDLVAASRAWMPATHPVEWGEPRPGRPDRRGRRSCKRESRPPGASPRSSSRGDWRGSSEELPMKLGLFIPCYIDAFFPVVGIATLE